MILLITVTLNLIQGLYYYRNTRFRIKFGMTEGHRFRIKSGMTNYIEMLNQVQHDKGIDA